MTCGGIAEGLELHFLESGIRVRPMEGSFQDKHRRFQEGSFDLTERAGLLVHQRARRAEPVHLKVGGEVAHRLYYNENSLDFRRDITRDTVAKLKLDDALTVLERAVVSESWDAISLPAFIEHIMEHRDDPNGVITGFQYTDEEYAERMAGRVRQTINSGPRAVEKVETVYGIMEPDAEGLQGSFDFDNEDMLSAFQRVMDTFGLDAWVDRDGTLFVGKDPAWGETIGVLDSGDMEKLSNYTITEKATKTSSVTVQGPFASTKLQFLDDWDPNWTEGPALGYGVAERTDEERGNTKSFTVEQAQSLGALERSAAMKLMSISMEETDGTIEFNGLIMPEDEQVALARITVGDHIVVNGDVPNACPQEGITYTGGHFFVESVRQRWNDREGWRAILEVGEVPPGDEIDVRSFRYNPRTGINYKQDPVYEGRNPGDSPLSG